MDLDIRVVIADDSQLIRLGLGVVLSNEADIEVVGEATTGEELLAILSEKDADVLLIDFTAEGFSLESVPEVLSKYPDLGVVAITPDQDGTTIVNALKAGVKSYVKKNCDSEEIISSVRETKNGSKFFCGKILETIHQVDIDPDDDSFESFNCQPVNLSVREQEIITLIAEGLTNGQIAEKLFLSTHTVNTHRKNIMQKLGVKNTASIVMYAVKANLVNVNKFLFSAP